MYKTVMNADVFFFFSAVQIYDHPYIQLNKLLMLTSFSSTLLNLFWNKENQKLKVANRKRDRKRKGNLCAGTDVFILPSCVLC